jgi:eukaryotic-like serine/threonine-protein kinase
MASIEQKRPAATETMRAAVVEDFARPLVVKQVAKPVAGQGEVVVRVEASGLCHTDIHAAHGDWPVKPSPPFIPAERPARETMIELQQLSKGYGDPWATQPWPPGDQPPTPPPTQPPLIAGRYQLRRLLGRGGMGAVWLATDHTLGRPVALKHPRLPRPTSPQDRQAARTRLRTEARLTTRIHHPGVVRIYDLAEDPDDPWIIMEPLDGPTLAATLRQRGPLPPSQVTGLGLQLLAALAAAHRAGVVHRDVKPANVQLCPHGRVVLTDFGIAATPQQATDPGTGQVTGSPAYMAPEQVQGTTIDPASDRFSLGATLYAAVEGRSPFAKASPRATLTAVLDHPPAPPRRAGPLGPILQALLTKDPTRRLDTTQAHHALQALQDEELRP